MSDNSNNTTNENILSGNGLEPIDSSTIISTQAGIIFENRGFNTDLSGFRLDLLGKNNGDSKNGK